VLNRLTKLTAILLMTSLSTACVGLKAPIIQVGSATGPLAQVGSNQPPATVINNVVSSACGWDSAFYPDQKPVDYGKRWTDREMLWLKEHNDKVADNCPPAK
jgi:hypothetical protein